MSQYLSHLADLALNRVDVVQPRLASRFEAQGDSVAPGFVMQDSLQEAPQSAQQDQGPVPTTPRTEATFSPQPHRLDSGDRQVIPTLANSTSSVGERREPAPISGLAAPAIQPMASTQKSLPELESISISAKVSEPAGDRPKKDDREANQPLLQPINIQHTHVTSIESAEESRQILPRDQQTHRQEELTDKPRKQEGTQPAPVQKPAATKPESIRIQPVQAEFSHVWDRVNLPLAQPVDITPPTIHVSIGRIEIRASQTNTPAAAKPRAANTMSLDDYLKQRNGEKP